MADPSPTAQCEAIADAMLAAIKAKDRKALAKVLIQVHERAVSCACVRAEREREEASKAKRRRPRSGTDG